MNTIVIKRNNVELTFEEDNNVGEQSTAYLPSLKDVPLDMIVTFVTPELATRWIQMGFNSVMYRLSRKLKNDSKAIKRHIETVGFSTRLALSKMQKYKLLLNLVKHGETEQAMELAKEMGNEE